MRLINKYTKEFKWFPEAPRNEYYILSHRWHGEETTMQGFELTRHLPVDQLSAGDAKVHKFCEMMQNEKRPASYVWVDTCCIDKTSSSELQEAINSMYGWYERAAECIVYLDDVDTLDGPERAFKQSKWFTRGWCLQELLSPLHQCFLNFKWEQLGLRLELAHRIEEATGIQRHFFGDVAKIHSATVAERMSWMSQRTTTREEDLAYALLGIFDISMSMLYGEGIEKAFLRLQKKLIHTTNDETIFAWRADPKVYQYGTSGLLAPHPDCFDTNISRRLEIDHFFDRAPYRLTNKGIEIQNYGQLNSKFEDFDTLDLNCRYDHDFVRIELKRIGKNVWLRSDCGNIDTVKKRDLVKPPSEEDGYWKLERNRQHGRRIGGSSASSSMSMTYPNWDHLGLLLSHYDIYVRQSKPKPRTAEN